jgi:phosphoribosylformylglycinamidine synthase subunit PurS
MKFIAEINIMPHKALLDPQGKAVLHSLPAIGLKSVDEVRIGKRITLQLNAENETEAQEQAETACKKLLVNAVMEYFEVEISKAG